MKNNNWRGYVYEHIVVAEKYLGRHLLKNEVVHHLDGSRDNNRNENLLVLLRDQHAKLHQWLDGNKYNEKDQQSKTIKRCTICGNTLQEKQKYFCSVACYIENKNINHPSKSMLENDIKTMSMEAIGRKYCVSGNAVKKWLIKYQLLQK
jgi:uncharacterized protein (DUF1330 family)